MPRTMPRRNAAGCSSGTPARVAVLTPDGERRSASPRRFSGRPGRASGRPPGAAPDSAGARHRRRLSLTSGRPSRAVTTRYRRSPLSGLAVPDRRRRRPLRAGVTASSAAASRACASGGSPPGASRRAGCSPVSYHRWFPERGIDAWHKNRQPGSRTSKARRPTRRPSPWTCCSCPCHGSGRLAGRRRLDRSARRGAKWRARGRRPSSRAGCSICSPRRSWPTAARRGASRWWARATPAERTAERWRRIAATAAYAARRFGATSCGFLVRGASDRDRRGAVGRRRPVGRRL